MKTDKLPQIRRFESVLRVAKHYKCDNDKKKYLSVAPVIRPFSLLVADSPWLH